MARKKKTTATTAPVTRATYKPYGDYVASKPDATANASFIAQAHLCARAIVSGDMKAIGLHEAAALNGLRAALDKAGLKASVTASMVTAMVQLSPYGADPDAFFIQRMVACGTAQAIAPAPKKASPKGLSGLTKAQLIALLEAQS